jgi:hypothetical protein
MFSVDSKKTFGTQMLPAAGGDLADHSGTTRSPLASQQVRTQPDRNDPFRLAEFAATLPVARVQQTSRFGSLVVSLSSEGMCVGQQQPQ